MFLFLFCLWMLFRDDNLKEIVICWRNPVCELMICVFSDKIFGILFTSAVRGGNSSSFSKAIIANFAKICYWKCILAVYVLVLIQKRWCYLWIGWRADCLTLRKNLLCTYQNIFELNKFNLILKKIQNNVFKWKLRPEI